MAETIKILGLDVSKGKVTACVLDSVPDSLKRYHQKNKFPTFTTDAEGLNGLLSLDFDAVALEPTGIHYARFWVHHLKANGKAIRWVGHKEIHHYRESNKLPNKSDNADALAIAAYSLERWHRKNAFVDGEAEELRYVYLQMQSLTRSRTSLINRLRQQLAHECPEIAEREISRNWLAQPTGILHAIAGERVSDKWQKELDQSVGTGISTFTRTVAKQILELDREELKLEEEIEQLLKDEKFIRYRKVLNEYGINGRTEAIVLTTIYPIERFLDENGREIIERIDGSKRYRSLSAFKLTLGIGKVQYQSGGECRWKAGGSSDCRKALYLWTVMHCRIARTAKNEKVAKLRDYYQNGTVAQVGDETVKLDPGKGNQRIMRVVRRLVEAIFYDLLKS